MDYPRNYKWQGFHPNCSLKPVLASAFLSKDGTQYKDYVPDWSPTDIII